MNVRILRCFCLFLSKLLVSNACFDSLLPLPKHEEGFKAKLKKTVEKFTINKFCLMVRKLELHIKPKTSVDQNMKGCPML